MVREDVIAILKILKVSYPQFYKEQTKDDAIETIDLWAMMFDTVPAKVVTEAVKALILTNKFPPTIAEVNEKISFLTQKNKSMTEIEAWNLIEKAIQGASYYAQENFNKLPEFIQKLVGSPKQLREWGLMEIDTLKSVVQSNFMRSYRARVSELKEYNMLPESGKIMIANNLEKLRLLESGEADD